MQECFAYFARAISRIEKNHVAALTTSYIHSHAQSITDSIESVVPWVWKLSPMFLLLVFTLCCTIHTIHDFLSFSLFCFFFWPDQTGLLLLVIVSIYIVVYLSSVLFLLSAYKAVDQSCRTWKTSRRRMWYPTTICFKCLDFLPRNCQEKKNGRRNLRKKTGCLFFWYQLLFHLFQSTDGAGPIHGIMGTTSRSVRDFVTAPTTSNSTRCVYHHIRPGHLFAPLCPCGFFLLFLMNVIPFPPARQ